MRKQALCTVILLATLGGVGFVAHDAIGQDRSLAGLIEDLLQGRNPKEARRELTEMGDRTLVVKALGQALGKKDGTVRGKCELLETLRALKEEGTVSGALSSPSQTTRRAAALVMLRAPELGTFDRYSIAMTLTSWLEDEKADRCDLKEAAPALVDVVTHLCKTPSHPKATAKLLERACKAFTARGMKGLGPTVFALARDPDQDPGIRGAAFEALRRIDDVPRDEVQQFILETLADSGAGVVLRVKATTVLERKRYADEKAVAVLERVLFDPREAHWPGKDERERGQHWITQRSCLRTLSRIVPLDRLRSILVDPRVSRHPCFGIRADVAAGLASLRVENRKGFDTLCDYLVDEDPRDTLHLVRREAWLSLWALTGLAPGVPESTEFAHPPEHLRDEKMVRRFLFASSVMRPGAGRQQIRIVGTAARDLSNMKNARRTFLSRWETIQQRWNEENRKDEK